MSGVHCPEEESLEHFPSYRPLAFGIKVSLEQETCGRLDKPKP